MRLAIRAASPRRNAPGGALPCVPGNTVMKRICLPLLLAGTAPAQLLYPEVEFTELLLQPAPGGHPILELIAGTAPVNVAGYHLAVGSVLLPLPTAVLGAGTVLRLHLGVAGTNTSTEFWLPSAPGLALADSVTLFRSANPNNPADLVDYVGWGGGNGPYVGAAVQVGRWSAASESATVPALVGSTLANRRDTRSAGNWVGPDAWYDDSTPTLGGENDPAMTWGHAVGCVTTNAPGFGVLSSIDPGPWLGETTSLFVGPTPTFALLVLSTVATGPVSLAPLGMPLCYAQITIESAVLLAGTSGQAVFVYTVPVAPQLIGFEFFMQAFVPDPAAGNAAQAQVTGSALARVGSR